MESDLATGRFFVSYGPDFIYYDTAFSYIMILESHNM